MVAGVAGVQFAGVGIERHAPRVAQADRPKLRPEFRRVHRFAGEGLRADKRVVAWHEIVPVQAGVRGGLEVAASLVNIDPQDAAEVVVVDSLAVAVLVIAAALIAEAHVQVTVRAEVQVAAVVVGVLVELREHRRLSFDVDRRADFPLETKT